MSTHYQVLGVASDASSDDIRKAYRALALQYHPDKNGDEEALELFKQISEAYNVLIDRTKRAEYDRKLAHENTTILTHNAPQTDYFYWTAGNAAVHFFTFTRTDELFYTTHTRTRNQGASRGYSSAFAGFEEFFEAFHAPRHRRYNPDPFDELFSSFFQPSHRRHRYFYHQQE